MLTFGLRTAPLIMLTNEQFEQQAENLQGLESTRTKDLFAPQYIPELDIIIMPFETPITTDDQDRLAVYKRRVSELKAESTAENTELSLKITSYGTTVVAAKTGFKEFNFADNRYQGAFFEEGFKGLLAGYFGEYYSGTATERTEYKRFEYKLREGTKYTIPSCSLPSKHFRPILPEDSAFDFAPGSKSIESSDIRAYHSGFPASALERIQNFKPNILLDRDLSFPDFITHLTQARKGGEIGQQAMQALQETVDTYHPIWHTLFQLRNTTPYFIKGADIVDNAFVTHVAPPLPGGVYHG